VRGALRFASNPLTPPSPPSTGERGDILLDGCVSRNQLVPFSRCRMRSAKAAARGSLRHHDDRLVQAVLQSTSNFMMSSADFASRSPVGSSATISAGR